MSSLTHVQPRPAQAPPQRLGRLSTVADALALIAATATPVALRRQALGDAACLGAVLAQDIVAPAGAPPVAVAARDGWAVAAGEVLGASAQAPVPLGAVPAFVGIGDPMPAGTDAVLRPAAVVVLGPFAEAGEEAVPGEGIDACAADHAAGDILCRAGTSVGAGVAAAFAAAGIAEALVRRPAIRVLVAGAMQDRSRDAVGPLVRAVAAACGARAGAPQFCANPPDLEAALAEPEMSDAFDATIVVGGTGEGPADGSWRALAGAGEVLLHGMALAGGETAGLGRAAGRPVLLVPGRPDAALAALLVLGRPLFAGLSGLATPPRQFHCRLARKIASAPGFTDLRFVRIDNGATLPLPGPRLPLGLLASIEGWVLVPPESEGHPEGATVTVFAWP